MSSLCVKIPHQANWLPSHCSIGFNKHRTHVGLLNQSLSIAVKCSSSVLLEESKNVQGHGSQRASGIGFSQQNPVPVFLHSDTIGIIGGVSATATLSFLEKLVKWSTIDGEECLPFLVCSDPLLSKELSLEKSAANVTKSLESRKCFDHSIIATNLFKRRVFLEQSGARYIVMPCNALHTWYAVVAEGCSAPFLHIGDCVVDELKKANLKPIGAGNSVKVGVLGTGTTLASGFYQAKLQHQGFEAVLPDKATIEHIVIPASEALKQKDIEGARNLLRIALQVLLVNGVSIIILAADEMRSLLPENDPLLRKCIDPFDSLARSTVQLARFSPMSQ